MVERCKSQSTVTKVRVLLGHPVCTCITSFLFLLLSGILEEEVDDFDNNATIKAKNFFHSCMDMSKQESTHFVDA